MPTFSFEAFKSFLQSFKNCFDFLTNSLNGLINVIRSYPLFFIPLFLFLLLGVAFWVGWLILEASNYAGGSEFANPYKSFANPNRFIANPNRQFETKMPLWSSLGRSALWRYRQNKIQAERQAEKDKIIALNQKKADEFFAYNPYSYRLNIDGYTFWREGFEHKRWDKDGKMRYVTHFKMVDGEMIPDSVSVSTTEYDDPDTTYF